MSNFLKLLLFLIIFCGSKSLYPNNITIDSLLTELQNCEDKVKAGIYGDLAHYYRDSSGDAAMQYAIKAIEYAKKYDDTKQLTNGYVLLGNEYLKRAEYKEALSTFILAEQLCDKNDLYQQYSINNNLGILYKSLKEFDLSMEYYIKTLSYSRQINNPVFIVESNLNIGNLYVSKGDSDTGMEYYMHAIEESKKIQGFCEYTPLIYNNIGCIYLNNDEYEKSFESFEKAYKSFDSLKNENGMAISLNNMAESLIGLKEFEKAEIYIQKADSIHKRNKYNDARKHMYHTFYELYYESGNYEKALEFQARYYELKDSIYTNELDIMINDLRTQYEVDKLKIETIVKDNEIKQQRKINLFLYLIIFVISCLSALLIIVLKQKNSLNKLLKMSNEELTVTHKEIADNLDYARKIQQATMCQNITDIPFDFFTLDMPKSTVGGDFYFIRQIENITFIALADSTGHGISGGFLSVLGIQYLQAAIDRYSELDKILEYLNINFFETISKSEYLKGESLCISLISIENNIVKYAGSKHKIWKYNSENNELEEYSTGKQLIGSSYSAEFSVNSFNIRQNDCIFLSSDGYPDQFGANGKGKLKYINFRELLIRSSKNDMGSAKKYLVDKLNEWKGAEGQTDDILVMGIRV
jgi:serine phosphatase RsbU (regulator of sigma subunit)/Flp pilus assembly protein TadD